MVLAVYVSSLSCESLTWFNITMCSMHDLLISVSTEISYPWESFFGFRVMVVRLNFPFLCTFSKDLGFPSGPVVKNLPANAEDAKDAASIPGWERSPDIGNGNLLQYSCLENSLDRGAWWAIVHEVTKSWTQLSTHMHACTKDLSCHLCASLSRSRFSLILPLCKACNWQAWAPEKKILVKNLSFNKLF